MPVPEEDLPVLLPEDVDFQPRGKSPLAFVESFVNTTCPKCGHVEAQRETDTIAQWLCSCWYFLRYVSPHLDDRPYDRALVDEWLPVDLYIGGVEHAVLHLLYSRFVVKVLNDAGLRLVPRAVHGPFHPGHDLQPVRTPARAATASSATT